MKTLTLRGIDPEMADALRKKAERNGQSINKTAVNLLKEALGISGKKKFKEYHDLDHLAGSWTEEDAREFTAATEEFRKIDPEMWK